MSMVEDAYLRLLQCGESGNAPATFVHLSRLFVDECLWQSYDKLIMMARDDLRGATAVDVGCKYGHVLPLFLAKGAVRAIGIDVEEEYLEAGRNFTVSVCPGAQFERSDRGLLPLPPASADFVLVNEVISHVNPVYLETIYAEIARILRPGGQVVISDGNNVANQQCREDLMQVYDAWENGPAGRDTGRDVVSRPFVDLRRDIVRNRHPHLSREQVDYVARNTFGLFGELLLDVVDAYVESGTLIERPFQPGVCPTNPKASGVVMERGFRPEQVEVALRNYGLEARQVVPVPVSGFSGTKGVLADAYLLLRHRWRSTFIPNSDRHRGSSWGFSVLAVKPV